MRTPSRTEILSTGLLARHLAWLLPVLLPACANAPPADQIRYFSRAFGTVNTVGQPLLDDLAVAERRQGRELAARSSHDDGSIEPPSDCPRSEVKWQELPKASGGGFINGFCLADAPYFASLGDPPATRQFRGGLAVIEKYAEILTALAENRNVDAALGQVDALSQNVTGLLGIVGVATGPILPALTALQPILKRVAEQANSAEAKQLILEGAPKVSALIDSLRKAAPEMFKTLIRGPRRRAVDTDLPAVADGEIGQIEVYRIALSNYVVLLGKLQSSWDLAVAAASAPPVEGRLAVLVEQTSALRADAEAARRVFAVLRSGTTPAK